MSHSLALEIAKRFRKARKQTGLVSIVSIISTFSIALGVAALIIGLSAMNGFENELQRRVLSIIPHGEIYQRDNQPISDWRDIKSQLNKLDVVKETAPYVSFTGIIEAKNRLEAVFVKGLNINEYSQSARLKDFTVAGNWAHFEAGQHQIVIGKGLSNQLNVKVGDWVTLLIPHRFSNDDNVVTKIQAPKRVRFQIAAILDLSGDLGSKMIIMPLEDAQKQLDLGDGVTGIMVNVTDMYHASSLLYRAASSLNRLVYVKSWEYNYGYMYRDIQLIRSIMYLAMIIVIAIACFSIISMLIVAVKDKSRDIAILKTQGATNKLIRHIFIYYGLMAGISGSLVGVILGVIVALNLSFIMRIVEYLTGKHILSGDIYFIDFIPSQVHIFDIILVFVTTLCLSLIASFYPAHRASKIDPVKILRNT